MAEGWLRNLRIPMNRTRSPAPSTTFRQSVKLFCYAFFIHIVSIFLTLSLLVPLPLLLDPFSSDLPLFVSNGLRFFSYSLYFLIGCIIFDGCATCLAGTPPRWNPFRMLVTVLCGNQAFHAAELTAAKCWESIRPAECWFKLRGLQSQNTSPKILFLSLLLLQRFIETLALISAKRDLYRRLAGRNYRRFLETVKENKVILKIKNLTVEGLRPLVGLKRALSSGQLPSTSNRAQLGGQNQSGCRSTASHSQNERTRDQPQGHLPIEDLRPLVCLKRANAAKELDETLVLISAKCNYRRTAKRNLYRRPAKGNYRTFLEYLRSLGLKHADAAKELAERNYRTFLETEAEIGKENKENYFILKMAAKRWKRRRNNPGQNINIKISDFMKGFPKKRRLMNKKTYGKHNRRRHGIHRWPFQRSPTGSPYGGHIQSLLMKEIVRKTLKRNCRTSKWKDAVKNLGAKRIGRQLVIHRVSSRKHIIRPLAIHRLPFQQNWATLKVHCSGDERPVDHSQNERSRDQPEGCEGEIKNSTIEDLRPLVVFKRDDAANQPEGRRIFSIDLEDLRQLIRSADAAKELEALRMCRQLVIHCVSSLRHIIRPHAIHQLPFQQNWATLKYFLGDEKPVDHFQNGRTRDQPEGRNGKIKNLLTMEDLQPLVGLKRADAAKQLDAMLICRPLVIHPLPSLELIIRPHAIHRLPFQQNWATLKWYFSRDERPVDLISLCMEGKLVSRLQLIHIRIGRCLPRFPALPPSGEIVEPPRALLSSQEPPRALLSSQEPPRALLSSQLHSTSNRTWFGGQDRSGSTTSYSQNQRTRDRPEGRKGKIKNIAIEYLRPYSVAGLKRAQVEKELGVSPATFKRHCRYLGIKEWPILPPKEVIRRPDQNREKNPSPTFSTLSNNEHITTENKMGGQNLELIEHLQDSLEGPNFQSIGNGSIAEVENQNTIHDSHHGHCGDPDVPFPDVYNGTEVAGGSEVEALAQKWNRSNLPDQVFTLPDQNGENNPSPTFNTLSNNGQITTQNEMGGQHSEPNERLPDSFEDPNFQSIGNGSVAEFENHNTTHDSHHGHCGDANTGTGSVAEFENHNTIHDSHHSHCGDADIPFSAVQNQTEVVVGWGYFCEEVSGLSNFAFPVYSDAAAPSQPVPTILPTMPHSQIASTQILGENMESFEDWRNFLAPQKEPFPEGYVSGSVNYTISSISDLAPSQPMSTTPHSTESPEYLIDALASVVEHRMETNHYGSLNLIDPSFSNLAPSLPMQLTIPQMTSLLTERQDSTLVKVNAIYGEHTIKLRLPATSGITELKQVVSKQLKLGFDSFEVNYKDEHGEWILITLDEEVREHLQLTLSGNQVNKLWVVNKVPNTTDFCRNCECDKCRSLKGKRP